MGPGLGLGLHHGLPRGFKIHRVPPSIKPSQYLIQSWEDPSSSWDVSTGAYTKVVIGKPLFSFNFRCYDLVVWSPCRGVLISLLL